MSWIAGILRDLREFDWRELAAPRESGAWPLAVKFMVLVLLAGLLLAAGYQLRLKDLREREARLGRQQAERAAELGRLASGVAGLETIRQQARELETPYMLMLRRLPYESEIPALIDEIAALGRKLNLRFDAIRLGAELDRAHYAEQPIDIRLSGGFHEIGAFFSGLAGLGRIVTLHDFSLGGTTPPTQVEELALQLRISAYRYRPLMQASPAQEPGAGSVDAAAPASPTELAALLQVLEAPPAPIYSAPTWRNPFAALAQPPSEESRLPAAGDAADGEENPAWQFPVRELHLVGLIDDGQSRTALLRDPSGAVHRVGKGDSIGAGRGLVRRVTDIGLELMVWTSDENGAMAQNELLLRWEREP